MWEVSSRVVWLWERRCTILQPRLAFGRSHNQRQQRPLSSSLAFPFPCYFLFLWLSFLPLSSIQGAPCTPTPLMFDRGQILFFPLPKPCLPSPETLRDPIRRHGSAAFQGDRRPAISLCSNAERCRDDGRRFDGRRCLVLFLEVEIFSSALLVFGLMEGCSEWAVIRF